MKLLFYLFPLFLISCGNSSPKANPNQEEESAEIGNSDTSSEKQYTVKQDFFCKGKIMSVNDVEVSSRINEQIVMLNAKLGQRVRKGQVLVRLDRTSIEDKIIKERAELEQTEYQYQAILMGQGYKHDALDQAPETLRKQARTRSGYNSTRASLQQLIHQLNYCTILAPISGVITHIDAVQNEMAVPGKRLFRIIDTDHLKVGFDVLETELQKVNVNSIITVTPLSYPDESYETKITAVSPFVEQSGMVHMEAMIRAHPHLMPGGAVVVKLAAKN